MGTVTRAAVWILLGVFVAGCGGDRQDRAVQGKPPAEIEAQVLRAAPATTPTVLQVTGTAEAWRRVAPGSKLMGRIARVPVREGDAVRRGQVLAELDGRDLRAALAQARAALSMAAAGDENARVNHERMLSLHSRGSVTDKNLEDAVAAARTAAAAVEQAQAGVAAAEVNLDYAVVTSPLSGWVTARHVEAGDMATPGAPMFVVEDLSKIKVVLEVPEADVVGIAPGDPVDVSVDVLRRRTHATVARVVPGSEGGSRTYAVHVLLDNPGGEIKAGMFARATLLGEPRPVLRVPSTAVVRRGQLTGLFTVDGDGIAQLRWVRLGREEEDGWVEVLSGLAADERYLPAPPAGLADGTRVQETPS